MDLITAYQPVPALRVNMISSLDGSATVQGRSGPLGGPDDQAMMMRLRMLSDVILVGAGTIRVEGYTGELIDEGARQWRAGQGEKQDPKLAVVSRSGAVPVPGALVYPDAATALRELQGRRVLCEGGPHLLGSLLELDAVDELCLTLGPCLVGSSAVGQGPGRIVAGADMAPRRMSLVHAIPMGDLVFLRYRRG